MEESSSRPTAEELVALVGEGRRNCSPSCSLCMSIVLGVGSSIARLESIDDTLLVSAHPTVDGRCGELVAGVSAIEFAEVAVPIEIATSFDAGTLRPPIDDTAYSSRPLVEELESPIVEEQRDLSFPRSSSMSDALGLAMRKTIARDSCDELGGGASGVKVSDVVVAVVPSSCSQRTTPSTLTN